nr:reverse transcriptase domain-containing protein [Tanacetum cinerariifolium]
MGDKEELSDPWILFTDGSSCINRFGSGLIITNPKGMEFTYALRFRFNATNNEAEYEALIAGLRIAGQMGVQNLQANVDSKLVANQILPGTHNSCNHGSTNKTTTVQSGGNGKAAQMEIRTKRARHSVLTKDVSKRTNFGGLHRGASRGRHTKYINGGQGRTLRPMDIIHGRVIMHQPFRIRLNNHESERDGIHLCSKVQIQCY